MLRNRALRWSVLAIGVAGVATLLAMRLFPLQIRGLREDYRAWRMGLSAVHGEQLFGQNLGEGTKCIVLVHGIGDTNATWHRLLPKLKKALEPGWRILAWELPGHGRSERPAASAEGTAELRPKRMAERLWRATRAFGCTEKSIWVGNSLGGWVSAWVGLEHPDQVQGLVLLSPAGLQSQAKHPQMPSPSGLLENPTIESIREFRTRAYAKKQEDYPEWVWQAALERIQASPIRRTRAAMTDEDALDRHLGKIQVPTILIWGKQDRILPLAASQDFKRLAPESISSFREVDECGHLPQKECPDTIVTAVQDICRFGSF